MGNQSNFTPSQKIHVGLSTLKFSSQLEITLLASLSLSTVEHI